MFLLYYSQDAIIAFRQLLTALCVYSSHGLLHGDIKPSHVFYDAHGQGGWKLGGFVNVTAYAIQPHPIYYLNLAMLSGTRMARVDGN